MSISTVFISSCPFPLQTEGNEVVTHYLVKWRSLPYEDATWELEEDVDAESIRKFNLLQILPPEDQLEVSLVWEGVEGLVGGDQQGGVSGWGIR